MKKWRIVMYSQEVYESDEKNGEVKMKQLFHYQVQKRFLGFLWWYDPLDDGYWSDGSFDTYEEAVAAVENQRSHVSKTVVKEYE